MIDPSAQSHIASLPKLQFVHAAARRGLAHLFVHPFAPYIAVLRGVNYIGYTWVQFTGIYACLCLHQARSHRSYITNLSTLQLVHAAALEELTHLLVLPPVLHMALWGAIPRVQALTAPPCRRLPTPRDIAQALGLADRHAGATKNRHARAHEMLDLE